MRQQVERALRVATPDGIEQIGQRLAAPDADDVRHHLLGDGVSAGVAGELVQLRGQHREIGARRALEELDRFGRDGDAELRRRVVRNPARHALAGEHVERDGRGARLERLVRLRLFARGRGDEHEQDIVGRGIQIAIEGGPRILLERGDVADHDDPPLRHHGRGAHERAQRLGVEVACGAEVEVEVARGRIHRSPHELAQRLLLQEVALPVKVVDGLERALLERLPEGALGDRGHGRNIRRAGRGGRGWHEWTTRHNVRAFPEASVSRFPAVVLAVLSLSACSTHDQQTASESAAASTPSAQQVPAGSLEGAAAAAGIQKALGGTYATRTLTMADVERLSAAVRNIRELQAREPDVARHMDEQVKAGKVSPLQAVTSEPRLRDAISRAGLTPEDYFQISTSLVQAMTVAAMMRPEAGAMRLREIPPGVSRENVEFAREHETEIRKLIQVGG